MRRGDADQQRRFGDDLLHRLKASGPTSVFGTRASFAPFI
jgi:hypothetical protein